MTNTRKTLVIAAAALGLLLASSRQVQAQTGNHAICEMLAGQSAGVASNADSAANGDFSPASSLEFYQDDVRMFFRANCKQYETSLYTVAFIDLWHAILRHDAGKPWEDDAELAIQLLTKCASNYFGTWRGASCSNWQQKAISMKMQWEMPASP